MTPPEVLAAHNEREVARLRFQTTLDTIQQRLSPATLKQEAVDTMRETAAATARTGAETVRRHPGKIAAGIGLLGLFLARKPIKRAIRGNATTGQADEFGDRNSAVMAREEGILI